jgi:EAL domain-containing protein (putative c-di-GMP-specific phosphodiesterase class I)
MDQRGAGVWCAVGGDPLDLLLRPGTLGIALQPVLELTRRGPALWSVECLARGPAGTPFADPHEMLQYVRRRGAEIRMDRACVREAVRASRALPGTPRCSINVHARTLADDRRFPAFVLDELRQARLSPRGFSLEIMAPRDLSPALLDGLAQLRAVGISIGVDDVGLSGLDYEGLIECEPDYLKIDRCFVRGSLPDDLRQVMLESVVGLAEAMNAAILAQGIDAEADLDAVRRHGIRLVQGNLLAEPMTAMELVATGLLHGNAAACG